MVAEVTQGSARRDVAFEQRNGRGGGENLVAARRGHHARGARERWPAKDLVPGGLDRAGMQPQAHMDGRVSPGLRAHRPLCVHGGKHGAGRPRKRDAECIADHAKRVTPVTRDRGPQNRVVALRRRPHRLGTRIAERRAALDVGEQKREGLRRRGVHHRP